MHIHGAGRKIFWQQIIADYFAAVNILAGSFLEIFLCDI
jgi:hypothetical protein